MKKIIKVIFDSDLLHPNQKEKRNIEKIIDSIKIPIEKIECEIWIDKNYNDRITIDRKDFVNELSRALYYDVITQKASTILLQWFDEYKNKDDKSKENKIKMSDKKKIYYEGELFRKSLNRAGFDIVQHESIYVPPRTTVKIKTNVRFPYGIDDNFALVTLRSSYQGSGLIMPAVGILDSDYVDYLFITVFNSSYQSVKINKGDRFVQLVFIKNNDDVKWIRSD